MKSALLSLASLFLCLPAAYAQRTPHPWSDLEGCYRNISRNGYEYSPDEGGESTIRFSDESFFGFVVDQAGKGLPGLDLILFKKTEDSTQYYDVHPIFTDYGDYGANGSLRTHDVQDQFLYRGGPDLQNFTLISHTEIESLGAGRLRVLVYREVPEVPSGEFDADDEYILERKTEDCDLW